VSADSGNTLKSKVISFYVTMILTWFGLFVEFIIYLGIALYTREYWLKRDNLIMLDILGELLVGSVWDIILKYAAVEPGNMYQKKVNQDKEAQKLIERL